MYGFSNNGYIVQCTLYNVHCTMYIVHCTLYPKSIYLYIMSFANIQSSLYQEPYDIGLAIIKINRSEDKHSGSPMSKLSVYML